MAATFSTPLSAVSVSPVDEAPTVEAQPRDASVLPQSGYMTAERVKRHYSISNSTLYLWIAKKQFPAPKRIGPRAVRWSAESLRAFEAALESGE